MKPITLVSLLALCAAGCASNKETVYWERGKHSKILVHHIRKTQKGTADRTEELTAKTLTPDIVHTYDLGRMPDGQGGMHESHRFYQVVESSHFDLRLPEAGKLKPSGPRSVYTPPNYTPPPKDQRINDAVAEAREAKEKLDEARGKVEQQLATDNNLRGALQDQIDENQRLQEQLNAAMSAQHSPPPAGGAQSDASKGSQTAVDQLSAWGQRIGGGGQ